ncbi:LAMI_0C07800g1_1 [Lachancea mirantina]|uniref:LAMI_0C07800g1_1 n=1 Tax=Lachancea mirantina TaxID=1230905 RepID=A0A1G4J4R2_9SACH|nr:LAMI_0C07800g1_1 [Lachancea mirantina]
MKQFTIEIAKSDINATFKEPNDDMDGPVKPRRTLPSKSPSVPNLSQVFRATGPSNNLFKLKGQNLSQGHEQSGQNGLGLSYSSTNLSLIELYNDENGEEEGNESLSASLPEEVGINAKDVVPQQEVIPRQDAGLDDLSHYDRYGFKKQSNYINENEYDGWWKDYSQYCIRRKRKWQSLLEKSGFPMTTEAPDRFPPKSEKLKRYVRKGIPAEWRGNAWWHFARGQEKLNKNKGVYDKLLASLETKEYERRENSRDSDIIERDLNRTFPDNIHFRRRPNESAEPLMIQSLRRVLNTFSIYNPKIGYCQSLNFLAGLLLLFMDEERAFWMLVIITSRYLPGVHNVMLEGVNIDQGVLMLCIREYLPHFWHRIVNKQYSHNNQFLYKLPPLTLCTASWFMSCFVGIVPIETTLRIWDCLFYEESHVLFKISLSIMKLSEEELIHEHGPASKNMSQDDADIEVFQVIQTFPKKLLDPNSIFDRVILKRRISLNNLNQEEIDRCRKYVRAQRLKYKNYADVLGSNPKSNGERNALVELDVVNDALSSEVYGFRRSLTGLHWNNSIKEKVRQIRKK